MGAFGQVGAGAGILNGESNLRRIQRQFTQVV